MKLNTIKYEFYRKGEIMNIPEEFTKDLQKLLNNYGMDNKCNTPDYLLAEHLETCLETFANTVQSRDTWFNFKPFSANRIEKK